MLALCRCPGLCLVVVLRGGNCNNGSKCGARYLNANNDAAVANWNIGASLSYPFNSRGHCPQQCGHISTAHAENQPAKRRGQ